MGFENLGVRKKFGRMEETAAVHLLSSMAFRWLSGKAICRTFKTSHIVIKRDEQAQHMLQVQYCTRTLQNAPAMIVLRLVTDGGGIAFS